MDTLIGWGVAILVVAAMVLYCIWANKKEKKREEMKKEEQREKEWNNTLKRCSEILALLYQWDTQADHEVVGFSEWAQERGVLPHELDVFYELPIPMRDSDVFILIPIREWICSTPVFKKG